MLRRKRALYIILIVSYYLLTSNSIVFAEEYLKVSPKHGDGIYNIFKRYMLIVNDNSMDWFKTQNANTYKENKGLKLNQDYYLPIKIYKYNSTSIRSTTNNFDYDYAKSIQEYNEALHKKGIKEGNYRRDKILWVPITEFKGEFQQKDSTKKKALVLHYPIFGKKHSTIKPNNTNLSDCVFYIVSGHGGPDPGAIGNKNGKELHEDEYAYDVSLRLGKALLEKGAKVHFIVEDPDDGIRDDYYLSNDSHEKYENGQAISRNQRTRLQQRTNIINTYYTKYQTEYKNQFVIVLHVDSRFTKKKIDIFFYYQKANERGKKLAETMLTTIEDKYNQVQPGRGYEGSVSSRNLFMLRHTKADCVYIELGNIRNPRDQLRIVDPNNRQAVANWLTLGIINYLK